jgi:hypothetical protein
MYYEFMVKFTDNIIGNQQDSSGNTPANHRFSCITANTVSLDGTCDETSDRGCTVVPSTAGKVGEHVPVDREEVRQGLSASRLLRHRQ